jgi:hypothetical protein
LTLSRESVWGENEKNMRIGIDIGKFLVWMYFAINVGTRVCGENRITAWQQR